MSVVRHLLTRTIGWLVVIAAVTAVGITALVYSGADHREAVKSIARDFFVLMERASRVRRAPVSASASPTPEGGMIQ